MAHSNSKLSSETATRPVTPVASDRRGFRLKLLRIPLLFILISVPWIVLSDHWLLRWAPDIASYGYFQSIKGFLFIVPYGEGQNPHL